MKNNQNHIDKLSPEVIELYLSGDLTHSQMHQVEKLMLESDFDAEAMEGFEETGVDGLQHDIIDLNARIEARVKTEDRRLYFYLKIAASVLLIAIATFVTIELIPIDQSETISQSEDAPEAFEETLALPASDDEDIAQKSKGQEEASTQAPIKNEIIIPETSTSDVMSRQETSAEEEQVEESVALDFEIPEETIAENVINDEAFEAQDLSEVSGAKAKKELSKTRMAAKRAASSGQMQKLKGKVITEDSTPLPGVNIVVKGTTLGTVTDIEGNYAIDLPVNSDSTLVASFIGYESKEVNARGRSNLDIQLNEDIQPLSEVVVTAAGEEDTAYEPATPLNGYKAYQIYLENAATPIKNRTVVTVSFVVNIDGSLSDFEIIKGATEKLNAEAIDLIKNGPEWHPAKRNNQVVSDTVEVKVKFKPKK
ncbi:MAG: carboxypeptidase-like regulatory domain-containing protein [Fulvivirga sp.]